LKKKSYGFPLLRRWFSKTRFARKRKKVARKQGPIFPHRKSLPRCKNGKNVKSKSFLKEKSYGFPLLRRSKSKTGFARKWKKVARKQGPIFPHLEISRHSKVQKNVKSKSFLKKKRYGFPLLRRSILKTRFARNTKKVREKQGPIFPHLEISCHRNCKNWKKCKK
jgi:hypothetical protein